MSIRLLSLQPWRQSSPSISTRNGRRRRSGSTCRSVIKLPANAGLPRRWWSAWSARLRAQILQVNPRVKSSVEVIPMSWMDQFFFGFYPYLCMVAYFLGAWARFDRSQFTWRSQSSQFLQKRYLFWGSYLFHIGIIGLFFGHFFGLLTPPWVY